MKINWAQVSAAILASFLTHTYTVRLGNGTLSATVEGKPVTLTANAIVAAAIMAFAGQASSVEVGSVTVTYTPDSATKV